MAAGNRRQQQQIVSMSSCFISLIKVFLAVFQGEYLNGERKTGGWSLYEKESWDKIRLLGWVNLD